MAHMFCSSVNQVVHEGNIEELIKLIKKRKRVDVQDNLGWSPLHRAVMKNRKDIVEVLLNHPDTEVNCRNYEGYTSLLLACSLLQLDLNIAKDILDHGADPNIPNNEDVGPLHLACKHNSLELVKLLIHHHANVNSQDFNGYTPLHYAVERNSVGLMEYLLENNADANLTEAHGLNALMFTLQSQLSHFNLLLPHTKDLNAVTADGWTALLFAINSSNENAAQVLIKRGATLTAQKCNYAPLQLAIMARIYSLIELIWEHTDLKIVSQNKSFMWFFCKYCALPYCYKHYELILKAPGVDLHLNGVTGLFYKIFKDPPVCVDFASAKSEYLNVIGWLLDRNVLLRMNDVERILSYFKECSYTRELWQMIFAKTTPDITEHIVAQAIENQNYDLALLMITYCLHLNPEHVINFLHGLSEGFLRKWLALFTPVSKYRRKLIYLQLFSASDSTTKILNDTKPVKSLLELSRDAVRETLQDACNTTQDFLAALEKLEIPPYLKAVIRLQIPVNTYLLKE